ncbi:YihY/virulence factor BrkB family protein [Salinibacterium hongtaonis]|uniref:YihY/virulence factor BrkB family protein n=1 Tax=Homoserinimonas hongtaonis TaxID=2079791 RepID=UPI000D37458E|nr:YihY/virulence factor BrkB family protein [Salinibacterium hongtaonis]AWB90406.1 ribonuclease BN [Salinibacterium hongtaonis]
MAKTPQSAASNNAPAASPTRRKKDAPPPDDSRKPDGPTDVARPAWGYVFKRTLREFSQDHCTNLAAGLTYYALLSLFPALLALVSTLGLFGQGEQTVEALLASLATVADESVVDTLRGPLTQLAEAPAAGFAFVVGLGGALWSASGYVTAFSVAMNNVYEVEEGRPIWKLRPVMVIVTVVLLVIAIIIVVLLLLSGPVADAIGEALGLSAAVVTVWNIVKWPVVVAFAVLLVAVLYHSTPNVKQPKVRWISPGALVGLIVLALASLGFFFYVSNFANYNATYGSIGGVIVLLLWLWIVNLALLFGAEFDAELERGRELQGGIEAEEAIQLPPRDTRQIEKNEKKDQALIDQGRELRERTALDGSAEGSREPR